MKEHRKLNQNKWSPWRCLQNSLSDIVFSWEHGEPSILLGSSFLSYNESHPQKFSFFITVAYAPWTTAGCLSRLFAFFDCSKKKNIHRCQIIFRFENKVSRADEVKCWWIAPENPRCPCYSILFFYFLFLFILVG